jgi:hypothetical protein
VPEGSLFTAWFRATPGVFLAARDLSSRVAFFTEATPDDLCGHRLYLGYEGRAGFAIDSDGDLQHVFNNGAPRGSGALAVRAAVRSGARTLNCFDGFLPQFYKRFGFVEVDRVRFDRALATKAWNYAAYGEPDVVFMRRVK